MFICHRYTKFAVMVDVLAVLPVAAVLVDTAIPFEKYVPFVYSMFAPPVAGMPKVSFGVTVPGVTPTVEAVS